MIAGFAGSVHECQSAADYDYNITRMAWAVHWNLPAKAEAIKREMTGATLVARRNGIAELHLSK
jgi:hypothetical protein